MEALLNNSLTIVLRTLGLQKVIKLWDSSPWLAFLMAVCIAFTLVWMFRLKEGKTAATLGKFPGSIAVAFIYIQVGAAVAIAVIYMVVHFGLGQFLAALSFIPTFIGNFLRNVAEWGVEKFANVVIAFAIAIWVLTSIVQVLRMAWSAFTGAAQSWTDAKAPNGVKLGYQIAGSVVVAVFLCNPEWNLPLFYIPGLLSLSLGVYTLFRTTKSGQQIAKHASGKLLGGPINERGDCECINPASPENPMPLLDKQLQPIPAKRGWKATAKGQCGWIIPNKAPKCPLCGHPNPCWQICESCGFAGEDKKGYRRAKPHLPDVCPECGHIHPPLPEWTKFHLPGRKGCKPCTKTAPKAQAQTSAPKPKSKACPHCGTDYDSREGFKVCPDCGEPLSDQPVAPASPAPVPVPADRRIEPLPLSKAWR
jgi:hypothetical protein